MTRLTMLAKCGRKAKEDIERMRAIVKQETNDEAVVVGLNGSYARREVTSGSDVDLFVLVKGEDAKEAGAAILTGIKKRLALGGFKLAASEGVFDVALAAETLCHTIGGMGDTNIHITRRMLLLLEGEWLHGQEMFDQTRICLIEKYVTDRIRSEQIALFLLNDIIRYWRTICVDYEYKIGNGKAPEIRLLKLRFSRMLLYMGGVVAVGSTYDMPASEKRSKLLELFALPPAERIRAVMGENSSQALSVYDYFLEAIDDPSRRETLSAQRALGDRYTDEYEVLRDRAKDFRNHLKSALEKTFPESHPLLASILL